MTNNMIAIDIETYANIDVLDIMPEPTVALGVLKDPVKIQAKIDAAKQTQIDKMALSPLTGKIACVGYYSEDVQDVHFGTEKEMLERLYSTISSKTIITYNGKGFDIPFIFKRGIINNMPEFTLPYMNELTSKYKNDNHIDLMLEFCEYGKFEKLDNLARYILGTKKDDFDVSKIGAMLQSGGGREDIAKYCLKDCEITWNLAKRFGYIN